MITDYQPETGDREREVMELCRERRKSCIEAEMKTRREAEEDIKFAAGEQWPSDIRFQREHDASGARPCLTINKTGQYVRQVVNDSRMNSPSIRVFPIGGGADKDTADVLNGMIRDIEQRTDADICYDTAIESTARTGEGYWRLITQYLDEDNGFEQELAFQRIRNMANVHPDPGAIDPAGADMGFCFVDEWMSQAEFKEKYGSEQMAGLDSQGLGQYAPHWLRDGDILVADYYCVEDGVKRTLALLKNGTQVILEEQKNEIPEDDIVQARQITTRRVIVRRVSGNSVLEKTAFPCRWIPVFRVIGEEFEVDGKVMYQGLIRPLKDSQRMYNYWTSTATEKGALETKAPYIGAEGQFEGHESQWRNANRVPYAYLEYKPVDIEGNLAPPPQRTQASFASASDVQMAQLAAEDMKSTVGIYDAGLGAVSNEKSGRAILARQREADTGTFHYIDNLSRAVRHCGRVLVTVLPKYINTQRIVRIVGEDDIEDMVTVNGQKKTDDGRIERVNDITVGRYDVSVSTGPSFTTRRLESAESMIQFVQAIPQAGQTVMDLVAKAMDWPGADQIAERLRRMIPPELLQEDEGDVSAEMQQMMAQVEALSQQVMQSEQTIEALHKDRDFQIQIATLKKETEAIKAETARFESECNLQTVQGTNQTNTDNQTQFNEVFQDAIGELIVRNISSMEALVGAINTMNERMTTALESSGASAKVIQMPAKQSSKKIQITTPSGAVYEGVVEGEQAPDVGVEIDIEADNNG